MAVLIPNKLLFLEHPRTASTSIRIALSRMPKARLQTRHTYLQPRNEKTLSVVRNPYDVLVSWWLAISGKWVEYPTFESFLQDCEHPLFVQEGRLFYFAERSDSIIKFENLETELNKILQTVRLPAVGLPHLNKTIKKQNYRKYYTPATRKLVFRRFGFELETFKYTW